MKRNVLFITAALMIFSGVVTYAAPAGEHALTSPSASWTSSLGVIFEQGSSKGSGIGTFQPFVRLQATGTEQGYNTDYNPVQFDEKTADNYTHSLPYGDVPVVMIDGSPYREFKLDINQQGTKSLLSLDVVKIYETDAPDMHGYATAWPTPITVLNWSTSGNDYVLLDSNLGSGQGQMDMSMYVPETLFTRNTDGSHAHPYITLYSQFGLNAATNDGPEDWGVIVAAEPPTPTPEPSGIVALFSGIAGMAGMVLKRRRQ